LRSAQNLAAMAGMIDWRHWHNEPWLIGGLVVLGWLWAVLAGPLRLKLSTLNASLSTSPPSTSPFPFPRREAICFYLALLVFYLAVGSPLDQIGERFLFSAHMLQHQLLVYPAAILFLLGVPHWMIDPLLGAPALRRVLRFATHPIICGLIYTLVVSLWHRPGLYDLALRNKVVHVAEHVMFFGAALFYWWPLLSPSRVFPAVSPGVQMLYIVGVLIGMTPIFAYITFSHDILYPTYEFAPRIFANFSPADDQLLAGVMMKIIGMIVSFAAFGLAFYRWYEAKK
jgi:putative membrane protein